MSSFSSALIRVASLYRGGGWVKCWVGVERVEVERLAGRERRQQLVLLSCRAGGQDAAVAVELEDLALGLEQPLAGRDRHVGDREDGRRHLAGDEPGDR